MSAFNTYLPELIEVTLSTDTSAYADNDVLADFQEVAGFFGPNGGSATIHSLTLIDDSDQGQEIDLLCSRTGGTLGTENGAVGISDANAREVQRICNIATSDYVDLVNNQIATKTSLGVVVNSNGATSSLWIGAVCRSGTPTYAADALKLRIYRTRH